MRLTIILYVIISIDCFPDMPVTATTDRCAQSGIFQVCIIIVGEYVTYPKVVNIRFLMPLSLNILHFIPLI